MNCSVSWKVNPQSSAGELLFDPLEEEEEVPLLRVAIDVDVIIFLVVLRIRYKISLL
jgi:hypothetical protein